MCPSNIDWHAVGCYVGNLTRLQAQHSLVLLVRFVGLSLQSLYLAFYYCLLVQLTEPYLEGNKREKQTDLRKIKGVIALSH